MYNVHRLDINILFLLFGRLMFSHIIVVCGNEFKDRFALNTDAPIHENYSI